MTALPPRLASLAGSVGPLDREAMRVANARQAQLTKPAGSLGRLEAIAAQVAGIQGRPHADVSSRVLVIGAADHGVTAEGVSAFPQEVTSQMVANFVGGGAAMNVLARLANARVVVADFGVASGAPVPGVLDRRVAAGTNNFARERAMTAAQAEQGVLAGHELAQQQARDGANLIAIGEMGIGNTTSASAIVACTCAAVPRTVAGHGTGIDDARFEHKVRVVSEALLLHRPNPADPLDVLSAVGGFEIAGLAGVIIGAAAQRIPIILDGFITAAAALLAVGMCPAARHFLIPSHCSVEPGHRIALAQLGLEPLFDIGMRLGEGTGALLAIHFVAAAVDTLNDMATFDEAAVSGREQ